MKLTDIHIAIIEDDPVILHGMKSFFESQQEFSKVSTANSVENFFDMIPNVSAVNVVLTDIGLPGKSGIEAIRMIREKSPTTDIIMITVFKDSDKIFKSLCAGATGYILKGTSFDEIKESVLTILSGGSYMSPTIARKIVEYFNPRAKNSSEGLTSREEQIVQGLIDGLSYKLIADRYSISVDTVRYHIKNIYSKLRVNSKSEVIAHFLKDKQ
jgi:DNA-binding NarL/FixJ family response regulator